MQYRIVNDNFVGLDVYTYEVDLPTQPIDVSAGNRTIDPSQVQRLPLAFGAIPINVRIRETLTGCDL